MVQAYSVQDSGFGANLRRRLSIPGFLHELAWSFPMYAPFVIRTFQQGPCQILRLIEA